MPLAALPRAFPPPLLTTRPVALSVGRACCAPPKVRVPWASSHYILFVMKSLLQFFLLIALVVVGRQVKEQARVAASPVPATQVSPIQQHTASIESFFVQPVTYKQQLPPNTVSSTEYSRKTSPLSLN